MDNTSLKPKKKFNSRMQARLLLVFCIVVLCLTGLIGRLVYLAQTDGERYAKQVLSRQSYVSAVIPYRRGEILDRNGMVLAKSELQYRLILDPNRILSDENYIGPTLDVLNDYFSIDRKTVEAILQEKPDSKYVILLKNLSYDIKNEYESFIDAKPKEIKPNIQGIWFEEEYVRTYPYNTLACDLIGFTSADNIGYWGIEEYYNDELNGVNGREYGYYDSSLNIDKIVKEPEHGNSIVSTIDTNAQRIIQKHIKAFNEEIGSLSIGILVMDPNNGEILAMASNQEYDLNDPRNLEVLYSEAEISNMSEEEKLNALNMLWRNDVISNSFEPGSTFKPFTIAAGLEEAILSDSDTFVCDGGENVSGTYIECNNVQGHGTLTLAQVLMKSCNDSLMQIGALEGRDIFYHYQKDFNLQEKTGIDLPGESDGVPMPYEQLNAIELATSSFGQGFNITMVQLASAYSSLVNGGYLYQPHMVKQIINDKGATVKQIDKTIIRQTVSKQTSELLQEYLYQTVEAGTAKWAKVEGYAVGGKTGTAEKLPRDADTFIVSFIGSVPAINPEIVIYVMIDEPHVEKQADSSLATKLAAQVMKELLPALGIYPQGEIDYLLPDEEEMDNESEQADDTEDADEEGGNDNEDQNGATDRTENGEAGGTEAPDGSENGEDDNNLASNNPENDEDNGNQASHGAENGEQNGD